MKKHLIICTISSFYFGYGMAIQQTGIKAGFGFWTTVTIYCSSVILWVVVCSTSLQKIKEVLYKKPDPEMDIDTKTTQP